MNRAGWTTGWTLWLSAFLIIGASCGGQEVVVKTQVTLDAGPE